MIKITSEDGSLFGIKVIETESGVVITKHIRNIEIAFDQKSHALVATLEIDKPQLDVSCLAKYVFSEKPKP